MIPRLVIGAVRGDAVPDVLWIGVRTESGREWSKRVRVVFGRFRFLARLKGVYHAYIETEPFGKGRREIGTFSIPATTFPVLHSDCRILRVRIEGEPEIVSGRSDLIGLASEDWCHAGQWIGGEPSVDLDRTYDCELLGYDRIFLLRENRDEIVWWKGVPDDGAIVLSFLEASRGPKPDIFTELMARGRSDREKDQPTN